VIRDFGSSSFLPKPRDGKATTTTKFSCSEPKRLTDFLKCHFSLQVHVSSLQNQVLHLREATSHLVPHVRTCSSRRATFIIKVDQTNPHH
jgi:hypothetical protein